MLSVMIEQLKEKYHFKDDCDFYAWLPDLKNWSESYNEHEDLTVIRRFKCEVQFDD